MKSWDFDVPAMEFYLIAHFITLNLTLENMPGLTQMKIRKAENAGIFIATQ